MIRTALLFLFACVSITSDAGAQGRRNTVEEPTAGSIQTVDEASISQHAVTPFMEATSAVLAVIDLNKIDADAMLSWIQETFGLDALPPNAAVAAIAV